MLQLSGFDCRGLMALQLEGYEGVLTIAPMREGSDHGYPGGTVRVYVCCLPIMRTMAPISYGQCQA